MVKTIRGYRVLMLFDAIIFFMLVSGCDNIDKQWHKYKSDRAQVWGRNHNDVEVISHGWKLIEKSGSKSYEWGWEVTIKINGSENDKNKLLGIEGIEYTLQDKDEFDLVSSQLNLDNYNRLIFDNGKKGPILQEYGQTVIYRQIAGIPLNQARRAAFGRCRILLQ